MTKLAHALALAKMYANAEDDSPQQDYAVTELEKLLGSE